MKKIVFGITCLEMGGAENVLIDIVNNLCKSYEVTIFTIYNGGILLKKLDSKIKVINLLHTTFFETNFFIKKIITFICYSKHFKNQIYNKYLKSKYDVIVAFLEGPITSLFSATDNVKKIAWIHTDIKAHCKGKFKKYIYKGIYKKYNKIIFVSDDSLRKYKELYDDNISKEVIYNYVNLEKIKILSCEFVPTLIKNEAISFLLVARLVEAKAIDRLIKVHRRLLDDGFFHEIYVIGDGPLYNNLGKLINELNVKDTFYLVGQKDNPYPYMKKAKYLLLVSLYEGFGMALLEGMILGKYILTTNIATAEILSKYPLKTIVDNDENGIYNGMKSLISTKKYEEKCNEYKYDNNYIIKKIVNIIEE